MQMAILIRSLYVGDISGKKMNQLKDKVVLITGAGKGAGRALALAFAEHGALIAANDISPVMYKCVSAVIPYYPALYFKKILC